MRSSRRVSGRVPPVLYAADLSIYLMRMNAFLIVLLVLAMLATLGVLFMGVIGMARGDSPARANKLMQNRILLQGVAIAIFTVLLLLLRH